MQREIPSEAPSTRSELLKSYVSVAAILAAVVGVLFMITRQAPPGAIPAAPLIAPLVALVALTFAVWLVMGVVRNVAVLRGTASVRYYRDYGSDAPDERIERPARTFNNLMQVPMLFYVVSVLMIATDHVDRAAAELGWLFVATRAAHAFIYIVWNAVPYRFAAYVAGVLTLAVMWTRFAEQALAAGW